MELRGEMAAFAQPRQGGRDDVVAGLPKERLS
jgi:hypothetical protein